MILAVTLQPSRPFTTLSHLLLTSLHSSHSSTFFWQLIVLISRMFCYMYFVFYSPCLFFPLIHPNFSPYGLQKVFVYPAADPPSLSLEIIVFKFGPPHPLSLGPQHFTFLSRACHERSPLSLLYTGTPNKLVFVPQLWGTR